MRRRGTIDYRFDRSGAHFGAMTSSLRLTAYNGRLALATIVLVVVAALSVLGTTRGYQAVWEIWDIPQMTPHFADLRNLTSAGDSIRAGFDPLIQNPGDPWKRPLNQPRIVQFIVSGLGLSGADTTAVGVVVISLFVAGIFLSLRPIPNVTALILATVIFSPAVMLGVERCNHDLFLFFLVALALAWPGARAFPFATLMLAAFIKLFPVFSVALFLREKFKPFLIVAGVFMALFCLYLLVNSGDLARIYATTQKGYGAWAYGTKAFFDPPNLWQSYLPMLFILPAAAGIAIWRMRAGDEVAGSRDHIDGFRVGAAIYLGTFFLGNNWDYRFIFLIFAVPQLVAWATEKGTRFPAVAALAPLVFSCWTLIVWKIGLSLAIADEIANWLLFVFLLYLMLVSLPPWVRTPVATWRNVPAPGTPG